jgi:uncharacterized protein (TIGR03067 family)
VAVAVVGTQAAACGVASGVGVILKQRGTIMRKLFATIVCLGLCAVVAPAQGDKGGPKIEGSWATTSLMFGDKKLPAELLEKIMASFTFKEGKYSSLIMGKQDEAGTYKIDAKMKPAHIDLMIDEGKDKGKTQLGLVAVEGDMLKLALAKPGDKDRPKNFDGGTDIIVAGFKRSK